MGDPKAFLNIPRQEAGYRPVNERIADYSQVEQTLNTNSRKLQASRCMDCGVPFCHWACPIGNKQPEWQDALYRGKWKEAYEVLSSTCDFPEFTGRICPALCEKSCVLKLSCDQPVTIRENEAAIVEAAFREGYIQVKTPERNGKKVAVIGAGPAGLVVANQLNLKGMSYKNAYLAGATYTFNNASFSKGFTLTAMYKYIQKHQSPNNFQLTGTWYVNFCRNLLTFSGFADWWREETNYGKTIFLSEPQFWVNLNKIKGVNKNFNLSVGSEVELSNNFGGRDGFYVIPTLALKWTLN